MIDTNSNFNLDSIPSSAYCKDVQGAYICANSTFLQSSLLPDQQEIIGKTDKDLIWNKQANILQINDRAVVESGKVLTFMEPCKSYLDGKIRNFLSHKMPIRSEAGKIVGILGISTIIEENKIEPAPTIYKSNKSQSFSDISRQLSTRQLDCLYYLVKGMTMKQIGKTLGLSPKTIEHYLEATKAKLNCKTRNELVSKGLEILYLHRP